MTTWVEPSRAERAKREMKALRESFREQESAFAKIDKILARMVTPKRKYRRRR